MTKKRFFLQFFTTTLILLSMLIANGATLNIFIHYIGIVYVILMPCIIISFIYSPREQKMLINEILKSDSDENVLKKSLSYLKSLRALMYFALISAVLMGIISMMVNLEDPQAIGPNLAIALLSPFYASAYTLLIIEPLKAVAIKKLNR